MPIARTAAMIALATGLAACGGGSGGGAPARTPDLTVRGVDVFLNSTAAFTHAPDFPSRLESTLDASLQYWGGDWSALRGRSITLTDDDHIPCRGAEALGCFDGSDIEVTTRDPSLGTLACVEETVLVHEIGHAVIGDPNHTDPRWMQMDPLAAELDGRQGYTAAGDAPCMTYVSMWRHPLGSP